MRNKILPALSMLMLLAACGPGQSDVSSEAETARLNTWLDARFEEGLDFSPIEKARLGRKDDYDRIDDASEAANDEWFAWRSASVDDLRESFDYDSLTQEGRTSYDLWIYEYELAAAARPFRRRSYAFHQMRGLHTYLPQFLITTHRVDNESDMLAYIARIEGTARAVGQMLERARLASAEGVHAPRFAYESVIEQSRALITGAPFAAEGTASAPSALWDDANGKIDALVDGALIGAARADELRAATRTALIEDFRPAHEALIAWAESELALAGESATGVWNLPDGPAFYEQQLAAMTTTDMSADEIHELGLAEVARIRGEMEALKDSVGFAGSLEDFFVFVREDPQFFYPNDDAGRQAYLDQTRRHIERMASRLPDYFGLLPRAELEVRRVEPFRERPGQAASYQRGAPDGSRPGIYYIHLIDMNANSTVDLESTAYHEALPGHHMQLAIAQERDDLPLFRQHAAFTAYIEGWGLYAEWLAREMGAYEDPYSDFGRLSAEIWRAIRLVVDTGLHAKRWTEAQAVEYSLANSPVPEATVRAEVERYLVMPGQATAYKVGMLKLQELRARAEAVLGEDFDIREFHDLLLGGGPLPLTILERRVEEWIAAAG